jgi:ATP-dependent phosphoenolpyruvate carboxykinase
MLAEKMQQHSTDVWLVNTGWSGGKYGEGKVRKRLVIILEDEIANHQENH